MHQIRFLALSSALALITSASLAAQSGGGWSVIQHQESAFANFNLGTSVAAVGDLNGDLIPDTLQGSPGSNSNGMTANGKLQIRSGADGSQIDRVLGAAAGDRLGHSVANAGDLTNDGVDDFLVGAPFHDGGVADGGAVYLYNGATRALERTWLGLDVGGHFGMSVAGGVDLDGDLIFDVLIGAPDAEVTGLTAAGRVFVYSGATGLLIRSHDGAAQDDRFGSALLALEDLDTDLIGDYVIGLPGSDLGPGLHAGAITAFSGLSGLELYTRSGGTDAAEFGFSLARLADRNHDGVNDLLIGVPGASGTFGSVYGAARIYSGADGDFLSQVLPPDIGTRFGAAVAATGDVDLDGIEDFLVGAPLAANGALLDAGALYFHSGATSYQSLVALGASASALMGSSVSTAGDMNGDRRPEIMTGSLGYKAGTLADAGAVDIFAIDPWMTVNVIELSASIGGDIEFTLDFPTSFANVRYEIFVSAVGTGPTLRNGVKIPLTLDYLMRRMHSNPPPTWIRQRGALNASGDSTSTLPMTPIFAAIYLGRTLWFAAITTTANGAPTDSSMPSPVTMLP